MFGPHRVKTIVGGYSSKQYMDEMIQIANWCIDHNIQDMHSYPGFNPGEVEWCFDSAENATLFALRWA